ncbi:MAG: PAS domain-containing hybrid sensor histidine kinase/response regulator [Verrucomicrobiia bacterium]
MNWLWKKKLIFILLVILSALVLGGQLPIEEITSANRLRSLNRAEAAKRYPVNITGTVLWSGGNGDTFFVADESDSIFVRSLQPNLNIRPGALVKISGVSDPGQLTPYIREAQITQIGTGKFPEPRKYTIENLLTGEADARWIETEGTVRFVQNAKSFLIMGIQENGKVLNLNIQTYPTNYQDEFLINARVRARGVCGTLADANNTLLAVHINVPYWTNIVFLKTNSSGVFGEPVTLIYDIKKASVGQLVKISGKYIKSLEDGGILIQDKSGEIRVYSRNPVNIRLGEEVEVAGFADLRENDIALSDAIFRRGAPTYVIKTIKEIRELSPEEAQRGYRVDITGSVTLIDYAAKMLFIEDETGGIFVSPPDVLIPLKQFENVRVVGITDSGLHLPYVKQAQITKQGGISKKPGREAKYQDLFEGREDSNFIQVRGVIRTGVIKENRGRFVISSTNSERAILVVHTPVSSTTVNSLEDAEVVAEGVCGIPYNLKVGEKTAEIHIQNITNIIVIKKSDLPIAKIKPIQISRLLSEEFYYTNLHRIVVEGRLFFDEQKRYRIMDSTGEIEVEFEYDSLPQITNIVRVCGYFVRRGEKPMIENVYLLLPSNPQKIGAQNESGAGVDKNPTYLPLLTKVEQVRSLSPEDAARGYPVWIKATITFCDGEWHSMFIHDGQLGIYVNLQGHYYQFDDGEYVEILGYSGPGNFMPVIREPVIKSLGKSFLPVPSRFSVSYLMSGEQDSQYVQVEGIVRSTSIEAGHLYIELVSENKHLRVISPGFWQKPAPTNLVDAKVRVSGACGTIFNQNRQIIGVRIFIQNTDKVEIIEAAPENPMNTPVLKISQLARYQPGISYDRRIRIEGILSYYRKGKMAVIEDDSAGVIAYTSSTNNFKIGDLVTVLGFVLQEGYTPRLENCEIIKLREGTPIKPRYATPEVALSSNFEREIMDSRLVKLNGKLVDVITQKNSASIVLQNGRYVFHAELNDISDFRWLDSFSFGDVLEVNGICVVQTDRHSEPQGFSILLRTPADIKIIKHAPWFTEENIYKVVRIVSIVFALAILWIVFLKWQVSKQTSIIKNRTRQLELQTNELIQLTEKLKNEIQERLNIEKSLRESEERYRRIFEGASDLIHCLAPDGSIIYANPAWLKTFGYKSVDEVKKISFFDLIHPDYKKHCLVLFEKLTNEAATIKIETKLLTKDGRSIIVEGSCASQFKDGKISAIHGIFRDITERKLAEEKLKESEERFSKAFHLSPVAEAIISLDDQNTIIDVNNTFCELTGFSKKELIGSSMSQLKLFNSKREMEELLQKLNSGEYIENFKIQMTSKDNAKREILFFCEPITIKEKKCALAIFNDLTRVMELERQLRQAQKMQAIGQLTAGIAHDFNNILTVIKGHTSLMSAEPTLPEEIKASINQIDTVADRASRLVKKLLAFSRQQIVEFKPINLNKLLNDNIEMIGKLIGEHIQLKLNLNSHSPFIQADPSMIEQILINLAANARDAMPDGGTLTITTFDIEFKDSKKEEKPDIKSGRFVALEVKDTGCGMDESVKSRIFEPFFTTKEFGKGSGLGLATVYGIVEQHKGWIEVESAVGVGTTFKIYFPAIEKQVYEEIQKSPIKASTVILPHRKFTVLVVEDEHNLRFLIRHLLERKGFTVLEAVNGTDAMKIWNAYGGKIDLLFTDIVMPDGVNGMELARQLKALKPNLKVIFSSGYNVYWQDKEFNLKESINFIQKPYSQEKLLETINNCLNS